MDYFLKLKVWAWFESYYQPEKIERISVLDPGFKDRYFKSLCTDLESTGKCCISKFDSTVGRQICFTDDPNKLL